MVDSMLTFIENQMQDFLKIWLLAFSCLLNIVSIATLSLLPKSLIPTKFFHKTHMRKQCQHLYYSHLLMLKRVLEDKLSDIDDGAKLFE